MGEAALISPASVPAGPLRAVEAEDTPCRVGPNAILQHQDVLVATWGEDEARAVFEAAGLTPLFDTPPRAMVPQETAATLHKAVLVHALKTGRPAEEALAIAREAGLRTGDYILANRIPGFARRILKLLPAPLAAPLLLKAIAAHAWTFAGSGQVSVRAGHPHRIEIAENPLAIGGCVWHSAVFERLFSVLVSRHTHVQHTACMDRGDGVCRFTISTGRIRARGRPDAG